MWSYRVCYNGQYSFGTLLSGRMGPHMGQVVSQRCGFRPLGIITCMCVSDHMGLQTRVGWSGFLGVFLLKIRKLSIFALILGKFCLQNLINSLKVIRFTSFFFYMILNKICLESHNKKTESFAEKRVSRRVIGNTHFFALYSRDHCA